MLYWSDAVSEPEKGGFEEKTKSSSMEIKSRSTYFMAKEIYISAQALTDAKFSIEIAFMAFHDEAKRKRAAALASMEKLKSEELAK